METNNEVKRTAGKWEAFIQPSESGLVTTINVGTKRIANMVHLSPGESKHNADFICEAVNNYDKLKEDNENLLKSLEDCLSELRCYDLSKETLPIIERAKEAIKKAESK